MISDDGQAIIAAGSPEIHYLFDEIERKEYLASIPNFGVWHLNIKEAAQLVALDMWFSGELEGVEEPKGFDGDSNNPELLKSLAEHFTLYETRLHKAVDCGHLKAAVMPRDFDEQLIPEKTYIYYDDLYKWLEEHGYEGGDHITEWVDSELGIASLFCDEVHYLRSAMEADKRILKDIPLQWSLAKLGQLDEPKIAEVLAAYKNAITENHRLREQISHLRAEQPTKIDRPVSLRQRRTLLTIIAALCGHAKIDWQARGAAQRIKQITQTMGTPVDDGTIAKLLAEIPDALDTRLK